jgi:hypothetical protein
VSRAPGRVLVAKAEAGSLADVSLDLPVETVPDPCTSPAVASA